MFFSDASNLDVLFIKISTWWLVDVEDCVMGSVTVLSGNEAYCRKYTILEVLVAMCPFSGTVLDRMKF